MASVEVTLLAREDLNRLIETRSLPTDTQERLRRSLLTLEEFPRAGKGLSGVWWDCRALVGPWGWLIVVYKLRRGGGARGHHCLPRRSHLCGGDVAPLRG